MKRFGSQFNKKAQSIKMSAVERNDLRARIVSYMEYHPLPKQESVAKNRRLVEGEPYRVVTLNHFGSFLGVFAMLILVIVPVVAERSVPGDILYPVKVQFNEELRSSLSLSPYAKIEWETKRLERRLAEARLLADEGKLTEEIEAEVAVAVQAHSDAAKQEIEVIRANDSDEAVIAEITLASALEVQSEVLESRAGQEGEEGRSVANLAGVVAEARIGIEASQEAANPSYEKLLARLEMETTSAQELFASVKDGASAEEIADIDRRFEDIKRKIDESVNLHIAFTNASSSPDEAQALEQEAKKLLKLALTDTRKMISFMTDIDVRTNVSIEDLLPITLTSEEEQTLIDERVAVLLTLRDEINNLEPSDTEAEKFELGHEQFEKGLEALLVSDEADQKVIKNQLTELETMAKDLLHLGTRVSEDASGDKATSTEPVTIEDTVASSSATSTEPEADTGE